MWETNGWFNDIKFEDFKQFFITEQKKYEQENYAELKLLASERAKKIIRLNLGSVLKIVEPQVDSTKTNSGEWLLREDGYQLKMK